MPKRLTILFLAHLFPLPMDSGGKIKSYYTLKTLAEEHDVSLVAYVRNEDELAQVQVIESMCRQVKLVPLARSKARQLADAARSVLTGQSFIVSRDYRAEMQAAVDEAVRTFEPDVIHIDHLQMAQFVGFGGRYRSVLDHHNVESMIVKRVGESPGSAITRIYASLEWPKLRKYELSICRRSDAVITVSEEDRHILRDLDSSLNNIHAVPIGVDVHYFQPIERESGSKNILSIATMYWPPNVDSMMYFHDDILPLVRRDIPDCVLTIAGQRPVPAIQALAADRGVRVTGYVADPRDASRDCGVFIVPLRSGSGVRVKILNAMAMALPVVSTSVGAEGLDVTSGEHLIIADTPEEFARAVARILTEPEFAATLGSNARQLVCEKYSWETVGRRLLDVYETLAWSD